MNQVDLFKDISDDWLDLLDTPQLDKILKKLINVKSIVPTPDKIFEFAQPHDNTQGDSDY